MKQNMNKILYNVVYAQVLSSNGRFLYACSNFNDIAIFNIEKITKCIENVENIQNVSEPASIFKCTEQPISLAFHRDFLIVGSNNASISGYEICTTTGGVQSLAWKIQLPIQPEQFEISEVNDMRVDAENDTLYAACANSVFQLSLADGSVVRKFDGHKDYVHSISYIDNNIASASEDGTVRLWDVRDKNPANTIEIEPARNAGLLRKKLGKWQGAVVISKEWLACGGATKMALFHISQINVRHPFHIFEEVNFPVHVAEFVDTDSLLVAGESRSVMQFSLKGNMTSEIETSGPAIYSAVWQKKPNKFLSLAGASNHIDVSTNFTYKDMTLSFYKREKNSS